MREPRRPNLATIVGSGLAVVAAGSLLAFSTLAEQAGLEGLATGRVEPARPSRNGAQAITVPAPATAPPSDPRTVLEELVRDSVSRTPTEPRARIAFVAPPEAPARQKPEAPRLRRIDDSARVALAGPDVEHPVETEAGGPPYGHAYGHSKNKHKGTAKGPKPAKKHQPKPAGADQPVYARSANEGSDAKPPKPQKLEKVKKVRKQASPGNGKASDRSARRSAEKAKDRPAGKAKGHSKHAHKGKGKGHSKHGG